MTTTRKLSNVRRAATFVPLLLVSLLILAALVPSASAAALANVDVSAPKQRAKAVETWHVQFTTVNPVPADGDIKVVFPMGFNHSFGGRSRCDIHLPNTLDAPNTTPEADNRTIVCGLALGDSIPGNTIVRLTITHMRNPAEAGNTGAFTIQTRNAKDGVIDQHTTNVETILAEQVDGLKDVDIRAPQQTTGVVEAWTFRFTTTKAVPRAGEVRIVFPTGFNLSGEPASQCQWNTANIQGMNSTVVGTREIKCPLHTNDTIAAARVVTLNVTGVRNPIFEHYTEPFLVQTRDGNTTLDESTQDQELISAHEFLAGPVHRQNSTKAGGVASHRFEFMLFNGWGADGMFEVQLPAGHSAAGTPNLTFERGGAGTFTLHLLEDNIVIFKRTGGQALFNGAHLLLRLDNILNPANNQSALGGFTIATLNATGHAHDRGLVFEAAGPNTTSPTATPTTGANTTSQSPTPTNATEPANTTAANTTAANPIGPTDEGEPAGGPAAGQGAPGLETVPVVASLVVASLFWARRRRA